MYFGKVLYCPLALIVDGIHFKRARLSFMSKVFNAVLQMDYLVATPQIHRTKLKIRMARK